MYAKIDVTFVRFQLLGRVVLNESNSVIKMAAVLFPEYPVLQHFQVPQLQFGIRKSVTSLFYLKRIITTNIHSFLFMF